MKAMPGITHNVINDKPILSLMTTAGDSKFFRDKSFHGATNLQLEELLSTLSM